MGSIYHGLRGRAQREQAPSLAQARRARIAQEEQEGDRSFDPGLHTVAEVLAYIEANPSDAARVRVEERNGRGRKSIVG